MFANAVRFQNDYDARVALNGLNNILPTDLRLIFNTSEYQNQSKPNYAIACEPCKENTELIEDSIRYMLVSSGLGRGYSIVFPSHSMKYIECKKCGKSLFINDEELIVTEQVAENKYAPDEPTFSSVTDEAINKAAFWDWAKIVDGKVENQLREWRDSVTVKGVAL